MFLKVSRTVTDVCFGFWLVGGRGLQEAHMCVKSILADGCEFLVRQDSYKKGVAMAHAVSPPETTITAGQAGKFADVQIAALRKSGLPSKETQQVLENQGATLADEFVASVRIRVEAISQIIVRRVKVDRGRTPKQVVDATGRVQYVDQDALASMPRGEGEEVDMHFFPAKRRISDDELAKLYDHHGFKPDPYAQAEVNRVDPAFADDHPNGTHWKDADDKWCYAAFSRWGGDGRSVRVGRGSSGWDGNWWFGGVRK